MSRRTRQRTLWLLLAAAVCPLIACGSPSNLGSSNAYWNNPTPSPIPTICYTLPPTPCLLGCTPGPGEQVCTTPVATMTPYSRWLSPANRGSAGTFYIGQDIRVGPLKLTLLSYHTVPMPQAGQVDHIFVLDTANESTDAALDVLWPVQTEVAEITQADGTSVTNTWWPTDRGSAVAGVPRWQPAQGTYAPGEHKTITLGVPGPVGRAHALGFTPSFDLPTGTPTTERPTDPLTLWILPQSDPHATGNASGPGHQGLTAAYPQPLPPPGPVKYGYFSGWPVAPNGGWQISQAFGCTDYPELTCRTYPPACQCYSLDPSKPFFHFGIDIAVPRGTPLLSVVTGRVTYVGPSSGKYCDYGDAPHENLGLIVQIETPDRAFTVKYGHMSQPTAHIGDQVVPGTVLGLSGSSGCSSGPHTHVQITDRNNVPQPPLLFIGAPRR